jgi:hypothetical protein
MPDELWRLLLHLVDIDDRKDAFLPSPFDRFYCSFDIVSIYVEDFPLLKSQIKSHGILPRPMKSPDLLARQ